MIKYRLTLKLVTYFTVGVMVLFGGLGFLLPAIYAIESPIIWLLMPVAGIATLFASLFCFDNFFKLVKENINVSPR